MSYPVMLNLSGKTAVVVGGGAVASRKVKLLLECGAQVRLVAPELAPDLQALWESGKMKAHLREYRPGDLQDCDLAFAATNRREVNRAVWEEARRLGKWVNVADSPELCDFTLPSAVRRGPLVLSVSTSGASPALAARLARELDQQYPEHLADYVRWLSEARQRILDAVPDPASRRQLLREIAGGSWQKLCATEGVGGLKRRLEQRLQQLQQ